MENTFLDQDSQSLDNTIGLSNTDKNYLYTAAKWSRFLGILGFVFTGFIVLAAIFSMFLGSAFTALAEDTPYSAGMMKGMGAMISILYLLVAALYFFVSLYLYNFGTKTKIAVTQNDGTSMTEGFKNLKSYFSLMGIIAAIVLVFYGIILLFGIGAFFIASGR